MQYEPTVWHGGDVLSAEAMNKIEQGIANGGGGALEVTAEYDSVNDITVLDTAWQDIYDAFPNVYMVIESNDESIKETIVYVGISGGIYGVESYADGSFFTDSSDGYPASGIPK